MPRRGLEHTDNSTEKARSLQAGGAECGALGAPNLPDDPDLRQIADAWADLPPALRAGIVAMVGAATENTP